MRRSFALLVSVTLVAGFLAVGPAASGAPPGDPFVGRWEAVDGFDGSNLTLSISGGSHRSVLRDDEVTGGGCPFETPAVATGTGTVADSVITIDFDVLCLADHTTFFFGDYIVTHDEATDTLVHADGTTYSRMGRP